MKFCSSQNCMALQHKFGCTWRDLQTYHVSSCFDESLKQNHTLFPEYWYQPKNNIVYLSVSLDVGFFSFVFVLYLGVMQIFKGFTQWLLGNSNSIMQCYFPQFLSPHAPALHRFPASNTTPKPGQS